MLFSPKQGSIKKRFVTGNFTDFPYCNIKSIHYYFAFIQVVLNAANI